MVITVVCDEHGGGTAVVTLSGRFDAIEVPTVRAALAGVTGRGAVDLVVDLHEVDFVDSAGLAALVRARRECRRAGGDVVLVRPAVEDAMRIFRLTQFDEVFLMVAARS